MLVLVKRKQGHDSCVSAQMIRKSLGLSESKESKPTYPMVRKKKKKQNESRFAYFRRSPISEGLLLKLN